MTPATEARLIAALLFYSSPDTYKTSSTGFAAQYDPSPWPVVDDKGDKARAALAAYDAEHPPVEKPT